MTAARSDRQVIFTADFDSTRHGRVTTTHRLMIRMLVE
jgi:hypothetical protein